MFIYYIQVGISQGILILCSKSFASKNYKKFGIQIPQKNIINYIFYCIYLIIVLILSRIILTSIGKNKEVIDTAYLYLIHTLPGQFFDIHNEIY